MYCKTVTKKIKTYAKTIFVPSNRYGEYSRFVNVNEQKNYLLKEMYDKGRCYIKDSFDIDYRFDPINNGYQIIYSGRFIYVGRKRVKEMAVIDINYGQEQHMEKVCLVV